MKQLAENVTFGGNGIAGGADLSLTSCRAIWRQASVRRWAAGWWSSSPTNCAVGKPNRASVHLPTATERDERRCPAWTRRTHQAPEALSTRDRRINKQRPDPMDRRSHGSALQTANPSADVWNGTAAAPCSMSCATSRGSAWRMAAKNGVGYSRSGTSAFGLAPCARKN